VMGGRDAMVGRDNNKTMKGRASRAILRLLLPPQP
jgi:hypothetical protein